MRVGRGLVEGYRQIEGSGNIISTEDKYLAMGMYNDYSSVSM